MLITWSDGGGGGWEPSQRLPLPVTRSASRTHMMSDEYTFIKSRAQQGLFCMCCTLRRSHKLQSPVVSLRMADEAKVDGSGAAVCESSTTTRVDTMIAETLSAVRARVQQCATKVGRPDSVRSARSDDSAVCGGANRCGLHPPTHPHPPTLAPTLAPLQLRARRGLSQVCGGFSCALHRLMW